MAGVHAEFTIDGEVRATIGALAELAEMPPLPADVDLPSPVHFAGAWFDLDEPMRRMLTGDQLVHSDPASLNVLVDGDRAQLVDWTWPMRGPSWIDGVLLGVRLISEGKRTPADAARWVSQLPGWASASPSAVALYARVQACHWGIFASQDAGFADLRDAAAWAEFWKTRDEIGV